MKTGEGKTLTATMPVYLNAISGKGVHVITVNEYLASRDATEMGELYQFLGLTVGLNLNSMDKEEKQAAYAADITYGTNNEFGFDYLRDNMVLYKEQKVQRPLFYGVIDEVDSILIDEARTPLIISGAAEKSTVLYIQANAFVRTLTKDKDYTYDEKTKSVMLTEEGISKARSAFGIENLFDMSHVTLNHHINQALKANVSMHLDVDYVVQDGEIIIVDQFTGRLMKGRRYSEGLHQAIEAKEGVEVQNESMTMATITFQNYFRMYEKLAGMTGTAKTEEEEFRNIYNMNVIVIPTNRPIIRDDRPDLIYSSMDGKFRAVVEDIDAGEGRTGRAARAQPRHRLAHPGDLVHHAGAARHASALAGLRPAAVAVEVLRVLPGLRGGRRRRAGPRRCVAPVERGEISGSLSAVTRTTVLSGVVILLTTPLQAIGEEYLFRGYLLQAVGSLFGSRWIAIVADGHDVRLAHGAQNFPLFFDRFAFGLIAAWLVRSAGGLEAASGCTS